MLPNYIAQATWKSTVTSRLYLDAGAQAQVTDWNPRRQIDPPVDSVTIPATEQRTGMRFRSASPTPSDHTYGNHIVRTYGARASASYVTGTHNVKMGANLVWGLRSHNREINGAMAVTLLDGVPRSLTLLAMPLSFEEHLNADLGLFVQDQWTVERLTLNAGVRYDYFNASVPAQQLGAGRFVSARSFAAVEDIPNWHDLSPRLGASYDLFGTAKTAVKVSVSKYVAGQALTLARANNPVETSVTSATRTWTDTNRDFIPTCDFSNPALNGECGPLSNLNFGGANARATRYDEEVLRGFGTRGNNWEVSAAVGQEVFPSVSLDVGYFRRWYNNQTATDNLEVTPADYSPFCVTAPRDARLPGGGGYDVCGLYDVSPTKFGLSQNLVTHASNFGEPTEVYQGVDVLVSARLRRIQVSGGTNTGRTATNDCFVIDSPQSLLNCEIRPPFQTEAKFMAVARLPWDFQASAAFLSSPGPQILGSYTATNAEVVPTLGRNLAQGAGGTVSVPLIRPGTVFGDRVGKLDMRFARTFRINGARLLASLDAFNLFNSSDILTLNNAVGPNWLRPTQILPGRLMRFSAQLTF
jgi:hypothetical protein